MFTTVVLFLSLSMLSPFNTVQDQSIHKYVVGEWNWIRTEVHSRGGGSVDTPETCQCKRTLTVAENGVMTLKENGKIIFQGSYNLSERILPNDEMDYQMESDHLSGQIRMLENDQLGIGAFGSCGIIQF